MDKENIYFGSLTLLIGIIILVCDVFSYLENNIDEVIMLSFLVVAFLVSSILLFYMGITNEEEEITE